MFYLSNLLIYSVFIYLLFSCYQREQSGKLKRVINESAFQDRQDQQDRKGVIVMTEENLRHAMELHGDAVYRLALCRLQSIPDAEDVYQDVFLRLFSQSEPEQDWDHEHLKAWLLRTTVNRCHDLARFRLRRPALSLEEIGEIAGVDDKKTWELWDVVARLPEKLRLVIHLYYAEDYQTEEIGELLGIPAATVRTRLRRGRMKLKTLLGGGHEYGQERENERESVSELDRLYSRI